MKLLFTLTVNSLLLIVILCGFPGKNTGGRQPYDKSQEGISLEDQEINSFIASHENIDDEEDHEDDYMLTYLDKDLQGHIISIDFGSRYSTVGIVHQNKLELVKDENDKIKIASVVSFLDDGTILVGNEANELLIKAKNLGNTIYSFKKLLGRTYDDPYLQKHMNHLSYKIVNDNNLPKIKITLNQNGTQKEILYTPEYILSLLIHKLKMYCESYVEGVKFDSVVISVPSYYNHFQKVAIRNSVRLSGLKLKKIINDASVAALYHSYGQTTKETKTMLILDIGASSFEAALVSKFSLYEDIGNEGDNHLGIDDMIYNLFRDSIKHIESTTENRFNLNIDIENRLFVYENISPDDRERAYRLFQVCEVAFIILSQKEKFTISLKNLFPGFDYRRDITRNDLIELNNKVFTQIRESLKKLKKNHKIEFKNLDDILLLGSGAKIPYIKSILNDVFPIAKREVNLYEGNNYVANGLVLYSRELCIHHIQYYFEKISAITMLERLNRSIIVRIPEDNDRKIIWSARRAFYPLSKMIKLSNYKNNIKQIKFEVYEGQLLDSKKVEIYNTSNEEDKDDYNLGQADLIGKFIIRKMPAEIKNAVEITLNFRVENIGTAEVKIESLGNLCRKCELICVLGICPFSNIREKDTFKLDSKVIKHEYSRRKEVQMKDEL